MKKILSIIVCSVLLLSLVGCVKSDAAKNVDELIAGIGEVTLESEEKITSAEEAYEALTDKEKGQIENKNNLDEARNKYNILLEEKKAKEEEEKLKKLEDAISVMGEATLDNLETIETVWEEYNLLSTEQKEKISNAKIIEDAMVKLEQLKEEKANTILGKMRNEEDRVRGLNFYYPKAYKFYSNGSWAADVRCFVLPYIGRNSESTWLRLIYNYTGDDWVFFKNIIFAVDGKQYYKVFNYFDIVHDNAGGDVWEYIDDDVSDSDIEMLWAIANSEETIVRFQGDNYSHDYTINATDKQAIRDALTVYELLEK